MCTVNIIWLGYILQLHQAEFLTYKSCHSFNTYLEIYYYCSHQNSYALYQITDNMYQRSPNIQVLFAMGVSMISIFC
ncbi:hypothetical protein EB796_017136 [Bugula neritina]|uniref:Uncharacterized protein n=1 Tax=Bugula neritina TaxID=10212 RepID=A0A7J7JG17_BUGNE|nr:hypothetical protein EB796_017136 [Bugula neritina]